MLRKLVFWGAAYKELIALPAIVQHRAGFLLKELQKGNDPPDWKPMPTVGAGVNELRIRDESGAYRVIYIARFEEAVYVLRCFEKTSQKTSQLDLQAAATRYRELIRRRSQRG